MILSSMIFGAQGIINGTSLLAVVVGLIISVIGVSLAYIISSFFNYPEMKGWAKTELGEVLRTIFILFFIGFAIIFIDSLIKILLVGNFSGFTSNDLLNPFYFDYALAYLNSLGTYFSEFATTSLISYMFFMQISGFKYFILHLKPSMFAGLGFISEFLTKYIIVAMSGWVLIEMQTQLLLFFKTSLLRYFLPLAVILRAFPLTRKTGSTILAFCLAGFFVYPLLLVMNSVIIDNYIMGEPTPILVGATDTGLSDYLVFSDSMGYESPTEDQINQIDTMSDDVETGSSSTSGGGVGQYSSSDSSKMNKFMNDFDKNVMAEDLDPAVRSSNYEGLKQNFFIELFSGMWNDSMTLIKAMLRFAGMLFGPLAKYGLGNLYEAYLISVLSSFTIYSEKLAVALLLFLLDLMILMTAMKDISLALGGDEGLLGFDRLSKMYSGV